MESFDQHIDYDLAAKYLAGECSPIEAEHFDAWINASDANREAFESVRAIWQVEPTDSAPLIDTDAAWHSVQAKLDINANGTPSNGGFKFYRIAAAVVLLIGIASGLWWTSSNDKKVLKTDDQIATLVLKDGTVVTLSPNSRFEYPESFDGETRFVSLVGQAFFEVAKDKDHPFIVDTEGGSIRVVGTAFEVNTRDEIMALMVEVAEGIVEVSNDKIGTSARVSAGERCDINRSKGEIEVSDMVDAAPFYWKDKTIKFRRTELKHVVQTLHDLLKLDIALSSTAIEGCELTVTFSDENPETILEIIAMTLGLELTQENGAYLLSGTGC